MPEVTLWMVTQGRIRKCQETVLMICECSRRDSRFVVEIKESSVVKIVVGTAALGCPAAKRRHSLAQRVSAGNVEQNKPSPL